MKKIKVPLVLVGITLLFVSLLYLFKPTATKVEIPAPVGIPVDVMQVQRQDFQVRIQSQAFVQATTEALLSAQVRGNITARSADFERGGRFQAGEVLITLDDRDYLAALKLAQANYSKASVALEQEQARSDSAIKDWQRLGFAEAPSDLVARLPQVAVASAEQEAALASVDKAQLDLDRTRITAPFDGRVIGDTINLGSYVTPGMRLGNIIAADKLKVVLPVSAHWRNMLAYHSPENSSAAASVHISLPAGGGAQWLATITKTSAAISLDSRQFFIIAEIINNSDNSTELLVGDYIDATILGRVLNDVFVIPRNALYEGRFVWLVANNKLYKRDVSVVWVDADVVVIDVGLQPYEHIAISPIAAIVSGTAVTLMTSTAPKQTPDAMLNSDERSHQQTMGSQP